MIVGGILLRTLRMRNKCLSNISRKIFWEYFFH
jgi:hypothetical protein